MLLPCAVSFLLVLCLSGSVAMFVHLGGRDFHNCCITPASLHFVFDVCCAAFSCAPSDFPPITSQNMMAHGQGIKRCLSTEDARELGRLLKKSRKHTTDSKAVLATDLGRELLEMHQRFASWRDELTDITQRRVEIKATLDNAKFETLVTFDDRGLCSRLNALSVPALAQVRAAMNETWAEDGPVAAASDRLWDIVLTTDGQLPVGQDGDHLDHLLRRIAHYFAAPPVPFQVKLLEESLEKQKRPGIIETEAHEELEQAYVDLFARAKAALVEVQEITQDRALTMFDLARFANYLHDGLLRMKASTAWPASSSNLVDTEKLYVDIGQNNFDD